MINCLKPLFITALPFVAAWLIASYTPLQHKWTLRAIALLVALQVVCFALLPMVAISLVLFADYLGSGLTTAGGGETVMTVDGRKTLSTTGGSVGSIYAHPSATQAGLHGLDGFRGVDVAERQGAPIYAPFDGVVESVGCDGIPAGSLALKSHPICGTQATWLDMRSADGRFRMVLLHGDYSVSAGQKFTQGEQVGTENYWGWATGSHSHVILWDRGIQVSYLDYVGKPGDELPERNVAALTQALAQLGYHAGQSNDGAALRVSHYDPSLGGTNCDSDCSTMASGQKVSAWVGGQNGIFAAACPPEWPFGTRFELMGKTYQCQDHGGWIQTRRPGEFDPAMGGFTAKETYHWVDLLDTPPVPHGTLVYDWKFVN